MDEDRLLLWEDFSHGRGPSRGWAWGVANDTTVQLRAGLIRASIPNPRVTATRGATNWGARGGGCARAPSVAAPKVGRHDDGTTVPRYDTKIPLFNQPTSRPCGTVESSVELWNSVEGFGCVGLKVWVQEGFSHPWLELTRLHWVSQSLKEESLVVSFKRRDSLDPIQPKA